MLSSHRQLAQPTLPTSAWGYWSAVDGTLTLDRSIIQQHLHDVSQPVCFVQTAEGVALAIGGQLGEIGEYPVMAFASACLPSSLGDAGFRNRHGLRYALVSGSMANGIASVEIVEAMSRAGFLGFFGAAGLSKERVEAAIDRLQKNLGHLPYGFNLIHSPNEQSHESQITDLYLAKKVPLVEASAYLDLTPHIVRYRLSGIRPDGTGGVYTPNRVIAKVSRAEVATKFLSPAPERYVSELVQSGFLTADQALLAKRIPMADDVTVEADSGGHTDNRPAITLLPAMIALRNRLQRQYQYATPPCVGLGGGIATPASLAAAFAMGAAYVVTGSINQACVESGSSDRVRQMLSEADQADIAMAPAADMFEMGVKVQVLKRGTMFAMRAAKLYELYRNYSSLEAIPAAERVSLEKTILRLPIEEVWRQTVEFFQRRDPSQLVKAEADAKHKMALVFRWYLGQSSRWANAGVPDRVLDYQVWCGPAMGAFNEWAKGSYLQAPQQRTVVVVSKNLLYGATLTLRQMILETQGLACSDFFPEGPLPVDALAPYFSEVTP